jgi:glycosyltransferase involved in cell wall biosynthesis
MSAIPKILLIESGFSAQREGKDSIWASVLDYSIYINIPKWWKKIEEYLRMDFFLALYARKISNQFDVILAMSEKVGIPLCMLGLRTPIVTLTHYLASPQKRRFIKVSGVAHKWSGVGYISQADRDFLISYYKIPEERLFNFWSAPIHQFHPGEMILDGPIISLGVAKRDYPTLIKALQSDPHLNTEIYISSRYGDIYKNEFSDNLPSWIHIKDPISENTLLKCYQNARFVVIPMKDTMHFTAGVSVALEASASGKAVIATKTKGMPSYVIDGKTGILVPPNDIEALKNAIKKLWDDPHLAYEMGLMGRQFVEKNFNPDEINIKIEDSLIKASLQKSKLIHH